jgi:hypothetical protein
MKRVLILVACLLPLMVSAKDPVVKVVKDKIISDGAFYAYIEKHGCGKDDDPCSFTVLDKNRKAVILIQRGLFKDPYRRSVTSPEKRLFYEFIFPDVKEKTPVYGFYDARTEKVALYIVLNRLFKDGLIVPGQIHNFIIMR